MELDNEWLSKGEAALWSISTDSFRKAWFNVYHGAMPFCSGNGHAAHSHLCWKKLESYEIIAKSLLHIWPLANDFVRLES